MGEKDFSSVCNEGYLVVPAKVLNAAEYGVPQGRERVIFFGFKRSELTEKAKKALEKETIDMAYDPYPTHTHFLNENDDGKKCKYVAYHADFRRILSAKQKIQKLEVFKMLFFLSTYNPYIPWDLSFFQEAIYSLRDFIGLGFSIFIGFSLVLWGLHFFISLLNSIG